MGMGRVDTDMIMIMRTDVMGGMGGEYSIIYFDGVASEAMHGHSARCLR